MTTLLPHQKKVVENVVARCQKQKGLFMYHHMGTGKTLTALTIILNYPNFQSVVFSPSYIKNVWKTEINKHNKHNNDKNTQKVNIRDYSIQLKDHKDLIGYDFKNKIVVIDEAHHIIKMMRNMPNKSQAYTLLSNLQKAKKIILLSGTPIYHDITDFCFLINIVAGKDILPYTKAEFRNQFMYVPVLKSTFFGKFLPFMNDWKMLLMQMSTIISLNFSQTSEIYLGNKRFVLSTVLVALMKFYEKMDTYTSDTLYQLDAEKLINYVSPYVDYYKPSSSKIKQIEDISFPEQIMKKIFVTYNSYQTEEWLKLVYNVQTSNTQKLREVSDHNIFTLSENEYIELGRVIGNLDFKNENGQIVYPPKFLQLLKFIQDSNKIDQGSSHVVYSSFYNKGILLLSSFFDKMRVSYRILLPTLKVDETNHILQSFKEGKFKVLLLHPQLTEGISIYGATHLHILEPVLHFNTYLQIIGRVIRFDSHSHLPLPKQKVYIVNWLSSNSGLLHWFKTKIASYKVWRNYFSESLGNKMSGLFSTNTSPDIIMFEHISNLLHAENDLQKTLANKTTRKTCNDGDDKIKCNITTFKEKGTC